MLQLFRLKRPAVAGAAHCGFRGGRWLALAGLACLCALPARAITSSLGTGTRLEGPAAGGDSVELAVTPASGMWTATANDAWLHLNTPSQSGTGGTNVFFSYEANPGATRTGTLAIAGLTVTVTQAGGTYAPVSAVTTLASCAAGLNSPSGVAVDGAGNLYIVDQGNNAVYELPAGSTNLITLANPASGLNYPFGVAVDTAGDVYITDPGKHAVYELPAGGTALTTLVSSGLSTPYGVAVDGAGNLYIADAGKHAVYELPAGGTTLTTLANSASGLSQPFGVAVDWLRNVYISDAGSQAVYELPAGGTSLTTLATAASGLAYPYTLAVDGAGNLYIGEDGSQTIYELPAGGTGLIPVVSSGLSYPYGVAVDGAGNLYIANAGNSTVRELPHALVVPTARVESAEAGSDNLPMVVPATANLSGVLARVSEFPWLTITGTAGGVVSFSFTANPGGDRIGYIELLGQFIAVLQGGTPSQGTTALVEGPAGGSDSVTLAINPGMGTWTATANDSWLHINPVTASGIGSTNVLFRYDPNPGATRTGYLTVNGLTVTVTQAGSTYAPITALTTLASSVSGLSAPTSVAVDGSGNVYIADQQNDAIYELPAGGTTLTTLADNASGLGQPAGVAVDGSGNVYITDEYNQTVFELPAGGTTLITLANGSSGLSQPEGVAVDGSGNIYIADAGTPAVYELPAGGTGLTTLANSASGLSHPFGVAVDVAGNVYISDVGNQAVYELPNGGATLTPLVSSGLSQPYGVAVDGSGNVLIADAVGAVYELPAGGTTVTTLANSSSGLISAYGVVVDGAGNVLIADQGGEAGVPAIYELPRAFVVPTSLVESPEAGTDRLPVVVPGTANLSGALAPVSDSPWLTLTGTAGGVVSFSFTANSAPNRTAHINLLGQIITVVQSGPTALGTTVLVEGPAGGNDSVVLAASGAWTTGANNSWLQVNAATASGTGSTNVLFRYDANPGATRTGTLTIAGLSVSVTQAGATYAPITALTTLASAVSGLNSPASVAVDGTGNVYIADQGNDAVYQLLAGGSSLTTLVNGTFGLGDPAGVAVDGSGNVYIADPNNVAVYELPAGGTALTTLVPPVHNAPQPFGVAVDGAGNLYLAETYNGAVVELPNSGTAVIPLTSYSSGLNQPSGVAVDGAGNLYIADNYNDAVYELPNGGTNLITLATRSSGLADPTSVAVDGSGNVYIADAGNQAVYELSAGGADLTTLANLSSGLNSPAGVAVDGAGNLYIADPGNDAVYELPRAFVVPTPLAEGPAAGSDSLAPVVPATANLSGALAPTSVSAWLTLTGTSGGVVSFSFTLNTSGLPRTARISLLGQSIPITQAAAAAATTVVLTSSAQTNAHLAGVTFTATVQAAGVTATSAGGTVQFVTNSVNFGLPVGLTAGAVSTNLSTLPRGTNTLVAVYSGDGNYAGATSGAFEEVITNNPPVAATLTVARVAGLSLLIPLTSLTTNWSDVDGDAVLLTGISPATTNGQPVLQFNVTTNAGSLVISPGASLSLAGSLNLANDQFSYRISDGQGGTSVGWVNLVTSTALQTGQNLSLQTSGSGPAVLTFYGVSGFTYAVQRSTNLTTGWVTLWTTNAPPAGPFSFTDTFGDLGGTPPVSAYYRLTWNP